MKKLQKIMGLLLLLASPCGFAQTGVTVTYYNGTSQTFTVAAEGKLFFAADNLNVKVDAATAPTVIPVNIIRKINLGNALATSTFGVNDQHLVLYPNPGQDRIRIQSDANDLLKTSIYALTGQLMLQGDFQPNEDIDVSRLATGLYLVQVNGLTLKFSKK